MENKKPLSYFLSRIEQPICICDGGSPLQSVEWKFHELLKDQLTLPFTHAVNMYYDPEEYDLSQFKTISFATRETSLSQKIKRIFDFDKSNLKCLIAQNQNAFDLIKDEATERGITIIGFRRLWVGTLLGKSPESTYDHPFFIPGEEKLSDWL